MTDRAGPTDECDGLQIEILLLGIPSFVGPALVGAHLVTLWLWIPLRTLEALDTHSGYGNRRLVVVLLPLSRPSLSASV